MTLLYDFEKHEPPYFTEKMIREEWKRRELKTQTILLCIASLLMYLCILLFTFLISPVNVILSLCGIFFVCVSLVGNGVLAIVFFYYRSKRRFV